VKGDVVGSYSIVLEARSKFGVSFVRLGCLRGKWLGGSVVCGTVWYGMVWDGGSKLVLDDGRKEEE